ncbi:MAG: hypothetical protein M3R39_03535 [Actinomycetota bacterium]|nr:hypothetical protein [Actinomycetota bacterium]
MNSEEDEPSRSDGEVRGKRQEEEVPLRGWVFSLLLLAAFGWLAYRSYPAHHATKSDPSFIDNIFANNLVLFAARLVLFSAAFVLAVTAAYVVYSMVRGMLAGQMLTKFGPFEVPAIQDLTEDVEMWQSLWSEATEENEELRNRLEAADDLFAQLYDAYQEAIAGKEQEENPYE